MGERHVSNLSAALKLCPKGLQQKGRSNSFSVTEATFAKVEGEEGSMDRVEHWGPRVAE